MPRTLPGTPPQLAAGDFRSLMSCWSTGVAVVTTALGGQPLGCTVNSVTSVSLAPPRLLVCLADRSRTLAAIARRCRFGLNLLPSTRADLAKRFAHGEQADRFADVAYDWAVDVPLLRDTVAGAVCAVRQYLTVADHVLVVAEPVWWGRRSRRRPLVCFDHAYWSLWSMARVGPQ